MENNILSKTELLSQVQEITRIIYDFSLVPEDLKGTSIIKLICKTHGEFEVSINDLLTSDSGVVCPECLSNKKEMKRLKNFRNFLIKARKVHGDKYDYSKVNYIDSSTKVEIICPIHGSFYQKPNNHISSKQKCPICGGYHKKTTEEFIKEAKEIHGNKYDYSLVEYINYTTPVKIICSKHGIFEQKPSEHLHGCGCPKCIGRNKTTEDFIKEAQEVHGNKYDYSSTKYINCSTKVQIICPTHGIFEQLPYAHINGEGCPKCYGHTKKNTEEFIKEAKKIHGNKYDYSLTEYVNYDTKIKIICRTHGEFEQTPNNHLRGQGCPFCSGRIKTTEDFIKDAKEIHGDEYDYSLSEYVNSLTPIKIICKIHGIFEQLPSVHTSGCGCPKCYGSFKKTNEEFIKEAKEVHGDKYNYELVDYQNNNKPVKIICPIHGIFEQIPYNHLTGSGCPKCGLLNLSSKLHNKLSIYLKDNNIVFDSEKKFKWLKRKYPLRLDFYLKEFNVAIEVHGVQHFKMNSIFYNSIDDFNDRLYLDKLKYELCIEHGIKIFYIADKQYVDDYELGHLYTDIEEMMNDIIKEGTRK